MRLVILFVALVACMRAEAAESDCEFDLAAVRAAATAGGPMRMIEDFTTYFEGTESKATTVLDLIPPDRMRRIVITQDGALIHVVLVGPSGWSAMSGRSEWEPMEPVLVGQMWATATQQSGLWPDEVADVTCVPATLLVLVVRRIENESSAKNSSFHE